MQFLFADCLSPYFIDFLTLKIQGIAASLYFTLHVNKALWSCDTMPKGTLSPQSRCALCQLHWLSLLCDGILTASQIFSFVFIYLFEFLKPLKKKGFQCNLLDFHLYIFTLEPVFLAFFACFCCLIQVSFYGFDIKCLCKKRGYLVKETGNFDMCANYCNTCLNKMAQIPVNV